jgi:hypothetical protein
VGRIGEGKRRTVRDKNEGWEKKEGGDEGGGEIEETTKDTLTSSSL